ncbi:hypothetical protein SCHPADRAFT_583268 [Schizopora paradoxa]|uniref:Uncharacterized protein n=1 Tax=Schizopora paradoxa TaxID=27342 RepID=A0A0H2RHR5_9AGAM|nr:hypothetical protein SCHPADRAFT_583268 [Schizopora paradoxa]
MLFSVVSRQASRLAFRPPSTSDTLFETPFFPNNIFTPGDILSSFAFRNSPKMIALRIATVANLIDAFQSDASSALRALQSFGSRRATRCEAPPTIHILFGKRFYHDDSLHERSIDVLAPYLWRRTRCCSSDYFNRRATIARGSTLAFKTNACQSSLSPMKMT